MSYACGGHDHSFSRRKMLGLLAGAAGGLLAPPVARALQSKQRQVLMIWLDGGMSQLESWDPKPGTDHGGPFRSIPSSIPGVHVSELLPYTAKRMHKLAVVRSMQTKDNSHSIGVGRMLRGDPVNRGVEYPYMGSAIAKLLDKGESGLPPYVWIKPGSSGFVAQHAGFLGGRYGALALGDGRPPTHLQAGVPAEMEQARQELRRAADARFKESRGEADVDAWEGCYDSALKLMRRKELFDEAAVSRADRERYGTHALGRHLLQARRLLEAGVLFTKVTSFHWDTHADNFAMHQELMPQIDKPYAALIDDLHERGLLKDTLLLWYGEFGRSPRLNRQGGREHWGFVQSALMAGGGVRGGQVYGSSDAHAAYAAELPVSPDDLAATVFDVLGVPLNAELTDAQGRPSPLCRGKPVRGLF